GPAGGPEEELDQREDHVYQRYLVGMLAPKASEIAGGEQDELAATSGDEGEEGNAEIGVPAGSTYFPSSMGFSFVVAPEAKEIVIETSWGRYLRIKSDTQVKADGSPANVWKRQPIAPDLLTLQLSDGMITPRAVHVDHPLVLLQGRMRSTLDGWIVTLFLINQQEERTQRGDPKDEVWVFQPKLRVRDIDNK